MAITEPQVSAGAWTALIDAIRRERKVVVEQSLARIRSLDSYRGIDDASLRATVESRVEMILDGLAARRPPGLPADDRESEAYGEMRARQGVSFADLLAGWRAGSRAFFRLGADLAPPSEERDRLLVELVELMLQWVDHASLAMAAGHRRGELARARELQHVHSNLTRRMLDGIASPAEIRSGLVALGLDPDAEYVAVRVRPGPEADTHEIEQYLRVDGLHGRRHGLTTLIDGDLCGFVTGALRRQPAPTAIGVSEPAPPTALQGPFRRATRALETAIAFGSDGVFAFSSLAVQASVLSDQDVGEVLRARYLDPLADSPVVLTTAEHFLANDGSIDATAKAESVALVFAVRDPAEERELVGLPELHLEGLADEDARALLATVIPGRIDERVRDRIVAETRGNPLALLELPRGLSTAQLAGGFRLPEPLPLSGRIEESFLRRLEELPHETQLLLLVAAAEPLGDPALMWGAATRLGVAGMALEPAARAGMLDIGAQVRFRHPLVRSARWCSRRSVDASPRPPS